MGRSSLKGKKTILDVETCVLSWLGFVCRAITFFHSTNSMYVRICIYVYFFFNMCMHGSLCLYVSRQYMLVTREALFTMEFSAARAQSGHGLGGT